VQSGTLDMLTGRTLAYYQIEADAGPAGTDAFVTIRAETQPGQPVTSNVAIGASVFLVYNPASGGQWLKTFEVSGGNVRIYGNLELDGSVTRRNVVAGDAKQAGHYMALAGRHTSFEDFMVGWTRTRIGNISLARCTN